MVSHALMLMDMMDVHIFSFYDIIIVCQGRNELQPLNCNVDVEIGFFFAFLAFFLDESQ